MSVAIVLTGAKDIPLIHWAALLAAARQQPLTLIWTVSRRGETKRTRALRVGADEIPESLQAICMALDRQSFRWVSNGIIEGESRETEEGPQIPLCVISITSPRVPAEVEKQVEEIGVTCLLLPRDAGERPGDLHKHLLTNVECEIVILVPGDRPSATCREILATVGEGPHNASCLRIAQDVAKASAARLVAVHVAPDVDEVSLLAAQQTLSQAVRRTLSGTSERVEQRVAVSRDVIEGITECVTEASGLIILGMKRHLIVRRFSAQGIAERLINAKPGPTIAIVQSALPLSSKFMHWMDDVLRGHVPQLPREQRVKLVARIQESSRWDFDFVLLICLSTLIAAGGLMQNSPSVVIGAMLVAPLMTPLLGTGLSLVQGNALLFRSTLLTVLRGFVVAFLLSWGVSWLVWPTVTSEMIARGSPRVLDIAVALVSGIAAAYASGRPNLLSALPGVAIAASLVPPIATSGMATWVGDTRLAVGSALLFITNIVAIVLGTALAFRTVGVRATHEHGSVSRWAMFAGGALLVIMLGLGVYESLPGPHVAAIAAQVEEVVAEHGVAVEAVSRRTIDHHSGVSIELRGPQPLSEATITRIRQIVFQELEHVQVVEVSVRLAAVYVK